MLIPLPFKLSIDSHVLLHLHTLVQALLMNWQCLKSQTNKLARIAILDYNPKVNRM
jgi:hypothetical protein